MKRSLSVLALLAMTITLTAGPALADPPDVESFDVVGQQFLCDGELLTVVSGQLVGRAHEHDLRSGLKRAIFTERAEGVVLEDESGTTYRAVGVRTGNFTFDPEVPGSEVGFENANFVFIGDNGKVGDFRTRVRATRDGEFSFVETGSCVFVEE